MRRTTIFGILALTVWGLMLSAAVYIYVHYATPQRLAALISHEVSQNTGLPCSISRVSLSIFPRPQARLERVLVYLPGGMLYAEHVSLHMRWTALLRGHLIPRRITLDEPALAFTLPAPLVPLPGAGSVGTAMAVPASLIPVLPSREQEQEQEQAPKNDLGSILSAIQDSELLYGLRVHVRNGHIRVVRAADSMHIEARGLNGKMRLPGLFSGTGDVQASMLNFNQRDSLALHGQQWRVQMNGLDWPKSAPLPVAATGAADPAPAASRLEDQFFLTTQALRMAESWDMDGELTIPGIMQAMYLNLHVATGSEPEAPLLAGTLTAEGALVTVPPIPLQIQAPFSLRDMHHLEFQNASLRLDADAATVNAVLELPGSPTAVAPKNPPPNTPASPAALRLSGQADVTHLSLPRWFGFARDLVPGIIVGLDNLSGRLHFSLTPQRLEVTHLEALLCGMPFTGTGGVDDFSKPVIRITANTPRADINALLPELMNKTPTVPVWPGPPPITAGEGEGPDYDILLSADKGTVWKFALGAFSVRCSPSPHGAMVSVDTKNFYSGALTATAAFEDAVALKVQLHQVAAEKPATLLRGAPLVGGQLTGKAALTGSFTSLDHFVASLAGTIQAQFTDGFMVAHDTQRQPFTRLDLNIKAAGPGLPAPVAEAAPAMPAHLPFTGEWNASLRTAEYSGSLQLTGPIALAAYSFVPMSMASVPGRLQVDGRGLRADMAARFSLDTDKDRLDIAQIKGTVDGGSVSGSLTGTALGGELPLWQGKLNLQTTALHKFLGKQGWLPAGFPEHTLQHLDVSAEYAYSARELVLEKMTGRLDDTAFSGSIRRTAGAVPHWQADMALGTLSIGRYLPQKNSKPDELWPADLFSGYTAKGVISATALTIFKVTQRGMRVPFGIEKGILTCDPISSRSYDGQTSGALRIAATPQGYHSSLRYNATNADMAILSREAGLNTILGGRATLQTDLTGLLRKDADIPQAVNGTWNFDVNYGYIADLLSNGTQGTATTFKRLSASGSMRQGVLSSDDINLQSAKLTATGKGTVNLVDWTLDCRLRVSTQGLSNIPVTYTGSLDAPNRSINALNVVAGAIGKLGSGLFGLVGDVLTAPLRLLKP